MISTIEQGTGVDLDISNEFQYGLMSRNRHCDGVRAMRSAVYQPYFKSQKKRPDCMSHAGLRLAQLRPPHSVLYEHRWMFMIHVTCSF